VALTIHLYEAILATLAILLWHLYQVMFDPDVYPMNWSWWNGRMPLDRYKDEHGLDSETILTTTKPEKNDTETEQAGVPHDGETNSRPASQGANRAES
jgi:hypothetical protein